MAKLSKRIIDVEFVLTNGTYVLGLAAVAGMVQSFRTVINGAVITADAVATLKVDGAAVSGGAITIAYSGSAQGDVDEAMSCRAIVNPRSVISVTVSGGPGGSQTARGYVEIAC